MKLKKAYIDTQIKKTGRAIEQFLLPPKPAALTVNDEAEKNSLSCQLSVPIGILTMEL